LGLFGKKKPQLVEPPIKFTPKNELPPFEEQAQEIYIQTRLFVANALSSRAESMLMALSGGGVAVQFVIDGISHPAPGLDRDVGATFMAMLKVVAGLDLNNRTPLQRGNFEIFYRQKKYKTELISQLSQAGEQLLLKFDDGTPPPAKMDECGMRPQMIEQLKQLVDGVGLILVSSPPHAGFTTTFNCMIRIVDRYIRNVVAVEDAVAEEKEVENAPITKYDSKAGEKPMTVLPKLLRTYPDVVCVRKLPDAETVNLMSEQPEENRLVVAGIAANDAAEALFRVMALKCDRAKFVSAVTASLNVRVLRMLCEHCKQQYAPPPQLLQQLGLPANKPIAFYRPGPPPCPPNIKPEDAPTVCPVCNGIGYKGRSAIFELLVLNDDLRKVLAKAKNPDELRKAAKKAGHANLLEEGVVAAARGMTSIQEVFRVIKGG
jgi:type II secretory ATPase GspE/PulE/Tfp pilus assembly ATPase PilB-like protein